MDGNQTERGNESKITKILNKIPRSESEKHLLETILEEHRLLQSNILSNQQTKYGREFK